MVTATRVLVTATEGENSDGPGFNEDSLLASHEVQSSDSSTIDNVAVVTGEPPVGPPVTDEDDVDVSKTQGAAPPQLPLTGAGAGFAALGTASILIASGMVALTVRRRRAV